jgi:hypothetical protein
MCFLSIFEKSDVFMEFGVNGVPLEATPASCFSISYNIKITDVQTYEVGLMLASLKYKVMK